MAFSLRVNTFKYFVVSREFLRLFDNFSIRKHLLFSIIHWRYNKVNIETLIELVSRVLSKAIIQKLKCSPP